MTDEEISFKDRILVGVAVFFVFVAPGLAVVLYGLNLIMERDFSLVIMGIMLVVMFGCMVIIGLFFLKAAFAPDGNISSKDEHIVRILVFIVALGVAVMLVQQGVNILFSVNRDVATLACGVFMFFCAVFTAYVGVELYRGTSEPG